MTMAQYVVNCIRESSSVFLFCFQGIPNLDTVSANLQQLWALSEEVGANQTQMALGRYDVCNNRY